ncbi:FadR/GntR family transcriptional regulator [Lichenihabitans psoromatis]|uniref:FadR/GntR family transcriptional regulator n=1 Tax=Lichenihabitans psoromatis TaxID=2528642 RepID=UPI0013F15E45|nr:FadR/GntR family transcriptional regulator [Lichenihabitans psoromatis]
MDPRRTADTKRSGLVVRLPRHTLTAEAIGRRIVGGSLKPGAVLPNADLLAREFKVSRPALREAIKLLAGKGLLEMAPRRGTVVRPRAQWNRLDDDVLNWERGEAPTESFIRNLFELRRMIEPEAAALAATRATPEGIEAIGRALSGMGEANFTSVDSIRADLDFHSAILTHSGNDFLATFAPAIETSMKVTFSIQRRLADDSKRFLHEHALVFYAIRDRDPNASRAASLALLSPAEGDALAGLFGTPDRP